MSLKSQILTFQCPGKADEASNSSSSCELWKSVLLKNCSTWALRKLIASAMGSLLYFYEYFYMFIYFMYVLMIHAITVTKTSLFTSKRAHSQYRTQLITNNLLFFTNSRRQNQFEMYSQSNFVHDLKMITWIWVVKELKNKIVTHFVFIKINGVINYYVYYYQS